MNNQYWVVDGFIYFDREKAEEAQREYIERLKEDRA